MHGRLRVGKVGFDFSIPLRSMTDISQFFASERECAFTYCRQRPNNVEREEKPRYHGSPYTKCRALDRWPVKRPVSHLPAKLSMIITAEYTASNLPQSSLLLSPHLTAVPTSSSQQQQHPEHASHSSANPATMSSIPPLLTSLQPPTPPAAP